MISLIKKKKDKKNNKYKYIKWSECLLANLYNFFWVLWLRRKKKYDKNKNRKILPELILWNFLLFFFVVINTPFVLKLKKIERIIHQRIINNFLKHLKW